MPDPVPGCAQRRRRGRCRPRAILALGALGLVLLGLAVRGRPAPLIVYNATASAPVGFYRVRPPVLLRHGDLVLAHAPDSVRHLAAERGYLPATVPLVKRIAALEGDTVCVINHAVTIDGRHAANQLVADRLGRPLPAWAGCRTLQLGDVFLLMEGVPDSFDGRYFGPISTRAIIGKLVPLWVR
jgi:conjugative transfer signal peptidase TraF